MKPSISVYLNVRGLKYHCRCWGAPNEPKLFLLHGWMDFSASFQFVVDSLVHQWYVIAPDWRGYGLTDRGGSDSYWFPDYFADLDAILAHFQEMGPVLLAGHSMGANVACLYAGIRPDRVAGVVNMEGFGLVDSRPEDAPKRYVHWLDQIKKGKRLRDYGSFDELADRLRANNPRLAPDRALFLAGEWGAVCDSGRIALRADPAHKLVNPVLYRLREAQACWARIEAPVLWMEGEASRNAGSLRMSTANKDVRKAYFPNLVEKCIPDAGHMLHHDQPEQVASAIEEFFLRVLAQSGLPRE